MIQTYQSCCSTFALGREDVTLLNRFLQFMPATYVCLRARTLRCFIERPLSVITEVFCIKIVLLLLR